jgi:RDD family
MKSKPLTHLTAARFVATEALNVAPALVGSPLALPMRRALAMGLDLVVVALLSGVSGFWLLGGLAAVVLQLRSQRGGTLTRKRLWVGWGLAALLGLLALNEARDKWNERSDPVAAAAAAKESAREAAEEAAAALREASVEVSAQARDPDTTVAEAAAARKALEAAQSAASAVNAMAAKLGATGSVKVSDGSAASAAAVPLSAASAAEAAAHASTEAARVARNRIADLESQLAEAKKPKPFNPRAEMKRLVAGIGLQFGWGMVYFSLLPAWWGGQTVGKKVFGLRVVEITGKPMTVMRCLKRYGGYAAGMATGGLGFGQMLWDPNRQGIQDKAAHTVVLDLRAAAMHAKSGSPVAASAAPLPVKTPPPPPSPAT